ncbi:hypothetical protein SADUNF_Sadunf06G0028800 [Salix dunnii]|uniref:Uncharacterized protein n=1 Tax=Salix dunnii TaxID=1413687 RepID=A0A835K2T3_9ROSI|nr:hypothetical protein SADUNF_Sadunf06G0028800 [Salix dunnii]
MKQVRNPWLFVGQTCAQCKQNGKKAAKAIYLSQRRELGGVQINGFRILDYCPKKKQHRESIPASQSKLAYLPYLPAYSGQCRGVYIYNLLSNLHHVTLHARYINCSDRTGSLSFCDKMPALETRENRPPEGFKLDGDSHHGDEMLPSHKKEGRKRLYRGMVSHAS